jgi:transcriptional regulator with XRE-family HTH domain
VSSKRDALLFPALLRHWRARRGLSQLDLALAADVSARHVSFLETGRAHASRSMILRLASALDVPLRDQNALLQASGQAPEFPEPRLEELPAAIVLAIDRMLAQQEPFPLTVLSRGYDVLRANAAGNRLFARFLAESTALVLPLNIYSFVFDPRLGRPFIQDWPRVAQAMLARLHREVLARPENAELAALLASVLEHEGIPAAWRQPDFSLPSEPTFEVCVRNHDLDLRFLTTTTQFSAPQNVTLDEIRLESYFPMDEATRLACERLAAADR